MGRGSNCWTENGRGQPAERDQGRVMIVKDAGKGNGKCAFERVKIERG